MTEQRAALEELIRSVLSYWRVDNEPTITDTIASTLLEHPEVVLAALGAEHIGWRTDTGRMCWDHQFHHRHDGVKWCAPVVVLPRGEYLYETTKEVGDA